MRIIIAVKIVNVAHVLTLNEAQQMEVSENATLIIGVSLNEPHTNEKTAVHNYMYVCDTLSTCSLAHSAFA